jgi:hypothetical protein
MRWAYPSRKDLEDKLLMLYGLRDDVAVQEEVRSKVSAAASIRRFSSEEVGKILRGRLEEVAVRVGQFVGG